MLLPQNKIIKNYIGGNYLQYALWICAALLSVFAISCKIEVIEKVYPFETELGCMLMQFAYSFSDFGLSDIFCFSSIIVLFKFINKKEIRHDAVLLILSFVFSVIYVVCVSYREFDDMSFVSANLYQKVLALVCIIGFTILFYNVLRAVFYFFDNHKINMAGTFGDYTYNVKFPDYNDVWIKSALTIFICWLPWMIMDYPGTFCLDSIDQLKQFFGYAGWSMHQPPFSTMIIGGLAGFGKLIGSINWGIFMYVLLHTIAGVLIFSYSICVMRKLGASHRICVIATLFYAVIPIWGIYVQWIEKSFLFNELIVLFNVLLIEIITDENIAVTKLIFLGISGFLASLIRSNGMYIVAPAMILLAIVLKKKYKIKLIGLTAAVVVLYGIIVKCLYPSLNISNVSAAEALSVPFMQTARYVVSYGDEVTADEKEAINGVLVYEALAYSYDTTLSDPVKMLYKGDSSKLPAYFRAYLSMFFKHPNNYIAAFINKNYAFLAPCQSVMEVGMDYGEEPWLHDLSVRHIFKEMPVKFFDMVHTGVIRWPIFKYFAMPGLYVWVVIILLINCFRNRKAKNIVIYLPALLTIMICFAGPSQDLRFILSVAGSLPILVTQEMVKS